MAYLKVAASFLQHNARAHRALVVLAIQPLLSAACSLQRTSLGAEDPELLPEEEDQPLQVRGHDQGEEARI